MQKHMVLDVDAPGSGGGAQTLSDDEKQAVDQLRKQYGAMQAELAKVIIGQDKVIEEMLICILSRGHSLLMGVPGLAKTMMVNSLSQIMSLQFSRIQFTPDLMPSDITGTEILQETEQAGRRAFEFQKGPVFANIVLADEINRTPPKTQSALLEAMQEHRVTTGGVHRAPLKMTAFQQSHHIGLAVQLGMNCCSHGRPSKPTTLNKKTLNKKI